MRQVSILIACLCVVVLGCHKAPQTTSAEELTRLITTIRPWCVEPTYGSEDWERIIQVAKIAQGTESNTVAEALDLFSKQTTLRSHAEPRARYERAQLNYLEDSKVLLLFKVMFEWPENTRGVGSGRGCPGWVYRHLDVNADGTVNLCWPLTWKDGHPSLTAGWGGYEGAELDWRSEYLRLLKELPYRQLHGR